MAPLTAAFHQGLAEQGFVEGANVRIFYRWADNRNDRLPSIAADLVGRRVDVIFATAGPAPALAAKAATSTIPVVFQQGSEPVTLGLVESLNRPGGNITGISALSELLPPKRLQILHELVPGAMTIAYLVNPTTPDDGHVQEVEVAARILGVRLLVLTAIDDAEIEAAFAGVVQRQIGGLVVDSDALFFNQRDQLVELAFRYKLPTIYHAHEITKAGGLISYGPSFSDAWRLAGTYVGRILKSEKPADLPVQAPVKYETVLNMKAAKALGVTVPLTLQVAADEVIE